MKLLTFKHNDNQRLGWLLDDNQTVLSVDPNNTNVTQTLEELIKGGVDAQKQFEAAKSSMDKFNFNDIDIIEPLEPNGIFCVGLNYADHIDEVDLKCSDYPTLFWRLARNNIPTGDPLLIPNISNTLDWEGELVAVIGTGGRHISADNALEHVYGYSIYNDGSVRAYQHHSSQIGLGKNFHATGAFGPIVVTADEFGDPYAHDITTTIDGEIVQSAKISLMLHKIEDVIAYISSSMELHPGDIICTGTPSGVGAGMKPPRFLKDGEIVEITISGIGTLSNPVHQEPTLNN